MKIKLKFWFFGNYWWLTLVVFVAVAAGMMLFQSGFGLKSLATLLGTFLTLIYFLQKHRLEETKLFREIFAECNARYDKMNDVLNAIVDGPENQPLLPEERAILNDYFNLCGEEYLYYTQGYIFPSVWKAWYNGMKFFISKPRIGAVWAEEKNSESYYGISL
jgi:hypothetical protein